MVDWPTRKFFKIDFRKNVIEKRLVWTLYKWSNPLLFLWKLKTFHFSSIEFSRSVVWPFWSYRKIALSLVNISDTYKVYLKCLEKNFRHIFENHIFAKKLFFIRVWPIFAWKKSFSEKILILKMRSKIFSRHFRNTL